MASQADTNVVAYIDIMVMTYFDTESSLHIDDGFHGGSNGLTLLTAYANRVELILW